MAKKLVSTEVSVEDAPTQEKGVKELMNKVGDEIRAVFRANDIDEYAVIFQPCDLEGLYPVTSIVKGELKTRLFFEAILRNKNSEWLNEIEP